MKQYKVGDIISPNEEEIEIYPYAYRDNGLYWRITELEDTFVKCASVSTGMLFRILYRRIADYQVNKVIAIW